MNGSDPPVGVRGDKEGWGDEEEEEGKEEPRSSSLDCDHWMYHLCHHLNRSKNMIIYYNNIYKMTVCNVSFFFKKH